MPTRVNLPASLRRALEAHCTARYPHEAGGFLVGCVRGTEVDLVELCEATNRARDPRASFELEPLELVRAEVETRARGLTLVGLWHSHPEWQPVPSAADRAGLAGTGVQLIVEVRAGRVAGLRAWALAAEAALELTLEFVVDGAADSADTGASRAGRP
jgi:proteasome lid subunit RPN8/RPN11